MRPTAILIITASLVLIYSFRSHAVPTLYPDRLSRRIINPTNSNYIVDTRDPWRIYVLPPMTAEVKPRGLHTVTANVGFCKEISELQKFNLDTLELINSMKVKDAQTRAQVENEKQALLEANRKMSEFASSMGLQELMALDVRLQQVELRLDTLYERYKSCLRDCDVVARDIQDSQKIRTELSARRLSLGSSNAQVMYEYERNKNRVQAHEKNLLTLETNWKKLQLDLLDLYQQFNRMFDAHARREGGRVAVTYDSGWSRNLEILKRQNPQYNFEKIPTKNAQIRSSLLSKSQLPLEGSIISFDVGGVSADGVLALGSYPEAFSGNAVLNLLGVCPLLHPEWFGLTKAPAIEQMIYGMTVGYEYPAAMKYEVKVSYNLYRMYELIKSQGKSSGFFTSKVWSHHDEALFFQDTFHVEWKNQNDQNKLSLEQRRAIESDLRRQILSRLASNLVMSDPSLRVALTNQPQNTGAVVLAESLMKVCPLNIYCQGASVVLNVLQAVFGGSELKQSVKQKLDVNLVEHHSNEEIVMQPMLTTYK